MLKIRIKILKLRFLSYTQEIKYEDDENENESVIKKPKLETANNSSPSDPIVKSDSWEYFSQKKIDFSFSNFDLINFK